MRTSTGRLVFTNHQVGRAWNKSNESGQLASNGIKKTLLHNTYKNNADNTVLLLMFHCHGNQVLGGVDMDTLPNAILLLPHPSLLALCGSLSP